MENSMASACEMLVGPVIRNLSELDGKSIEDTCPICRRARAIPASLARRTPTDGKYYIVAPGLPCSDRCLTAAMMKRGVPERFAALRLDDFDAYTSALKQKTEFIRRWLSGDKRTGLLLVGRVGVGKTHLAVAAMREIVKTGTDVGFTGVTAFVMKCQGAFADDTTPERIIANSVHRYMVLDDLGTEKRTEFAGTCLFALVDSAYAKRRTIIATSNLSLKNLHECDPRLTSRLVEMCDVLEFEGDDFRVKISKRRRIAQNK